MALGGSQGTSQGPHCACTPRTRAGHSACSGDSPPMQWCGCRVSASKKKANKKSHRGKSSLPSGSSQFLRQISLGAGLRLLLSSWVSLLLCCSAPGLDGHVVFIVGGLGLDCTHSEAGHQLGSMLLFTKEAGTLSPGSPPREPLAFM